MTILVTGATGTVGRQVVEQLALRGADIRALVRDPAKAGLPAGVATVQGDLLDIDSLRGALSDLVGELSTRSPEFRTRWAAHDVRFHRTGIKRLHHPVVGDLDLTYEALELPADPGLTMLVYGADPGSSTADALRILGSLSASTPSTDSAAFAAD